MIKRILVTVTLCGLSLSAVTFADPATSSQGPDADITSRVVRQLSESDRDVARRIHVSTENGVVRLEGGGFTGTQAAKVLMTVRAVPGVTKVENRLRIGM